LDVVHGFRWVDYRVAIEALLGLRLEGNRLLLDPRVPDTWRSFEMRYRRERTRYAITVQNPDAVHRGGRRISLDGVDLPSGAVPLTDDGGEHVVRVVLGESSNASCAPDR
jgi:cyclic beta-1,2-glucan synthetase